MKNASDFPTGLALGITGSPAINADMYLAAEESIRNTEWTDDRPGRRDSASRVLCARLGIDPAADDFCLLGALH